MGNALSDLWTSHGARNEYRVLMWGLWYSGKTTLLYKNLKGWNNVTPVSTIGFNVESVTQNEHNLVIWDLGGRDKLRPTWGQYFSGADGIIYVVDATEVHRLDDAASELASLLDFVTSNKGVANTPLLVFANKQDLAGAKSPQEISEALKLRAIQDRKWKVVACSAANGNGVDEGMNWLVANLQS
ncbi:ADP-ribosylation factor family-domain-containing protein [Aspergillus ambiguus]|uniref:ADP-ribosylation factor family protein n=1 Tax=Aspergillus ambiguus TaxID=176160 RepID=UPI003CCE0449